VALQKGAQVVSLVRDDSSYIYDTNTKEVMTIYVIRMISHKTDDSRL
jgi:hypothetical protein